MIIGVDPGKTTGVFMWSGGGGIRIEETTPYAAVSIIDDLVGVYVTIVGERYTQQSLKITSQPEAMETIGALRYIARKHNWNFYLQSRADKSRVDDATLRKIGWYTVGMHHANDAARHALIRLGATNPNHDIVRQAASRI